MIIVKSIDELREARAGLTGPVGLVPTMGYLHAGHLSLVRQAQKECKSVVVSIFVNPTQFGPNEDFSSYPRDLEKDFALLKEMKVDVVWTPDDPIMYPQGFQTWVTVDSITQPLEGELRPIHFKGVTTVVSKLFNSVQPQKAFFGQKDAQQAQVIARMVKDLNFPIEVVICPIIREPDGLALSSRNVYLNLQERQAATVLSRSLSAAQQRFLAGEKNTENLKQKMKSVFAAEPLANVQYIAIVDPATFTEIKTIEKQALILLAVFIGKTRLIDNLILGD